jgi:hypothetical protein
MASVQGTYRNGKVEPDEPVNWPEGQRVTMATAGPDEEATDFPEGVHSIEEWLALLDSLEPIEMTAEEEAEWKAALAESRETSKAAVARQFKEGLW